MSGLTVSAERESVVDFTHPFWVESSSVLMRTSTLSSDLHLLQPLHWHVWTGLISVALICAIIMCGIESKSDELYSKPDSQPTTILSMARYCERVWTVTATLVQQGMDDVTI